MKQVSKIEDYIFFANLSSLMTWTVKKCNPYMATLVRIQVNYLITCDIENYKIYETLINFPMMNTPWSY